MKIPLEKSLQDGSLEEKSPHQRMHLANMIIIGVFHIFNRVRLLSTEYILSISSRGTTKLQCTCYITILSVWFNLAAHVRVFLLCLHPRSELE